MAREGLGVDVARDHDAVRLEPLQLGFIQRTPRGRVVTDLARAHVDATVEEALF